MLLVSAASQCGLRASATAVFDFGPRSPWFETRMGQLIFFLARFAWNAHWAKPSPLFARSLGWKARPSPLNCKNFLELALE